MISIIAMILKVLASIIFVLIFLMVVRLLIQRKRIKSKKRPDKVFFFIMRMVLRLRRNRKKMMKTLLLSGVKENMFVLDYGCGIGSLTMEASKIVGEKGKIIAADVNTGMLDELGRNIVKDKAKNITPLFIKSMYDVKDSNFDCILLFDVLHIIEGDKVELINFLLDKLKTDGKLIIQFFKMEKIDSVAIMKLFNDSNCTNSVEVREKLWVLSK